MPPPSQDCIRLRGVRQNNLKGLNLDIPLRKLIVITGLSGSGKSSLAFDTLYAEGQRRYIETFSPYARQFFDRMDRPAVDRIENIPPAIAIEQRNAVRSTRSTVGTVTEICDYLKVLWPHISHLHCSSCGKVVRRESPQWIWNKLHPSEKTQEPLEQGSQTEPRAEETKSTESLQDAATANSQDSKHEVLVTFKLPLSPKMSVEEQVSLLGQQGFRRLLVDDSPMRLEDALPKLTPKSKRLASLTVVTDKIRITPKNKSRFIDACEQSYHFGRGRLEIRQIDPTSPSTSTHSHTHQVLPFSSDFHCALCNIDYREPTAALFSFNHPSGACPTCKGFGRIISIDWRLALPDRSLSLAGGVVRPWQTGTGLDSQRDMLRAARSQDIPTHVPFDKLSPAQQKWVIDGEPDYDPNDPDHSWPKAWYGVRGYFKWLESKSYKMHVRVLLSRYRSYQTCKACHGQRLNTDSLLFRLPQPEGGSLNELPETTQPPSQSKPSRASATSHADVTPYHWPTSIAPRPLSLGDFYSLPVKHALQVLRWTRHSSGIHRNHPLDYALTEVENRLQYLEDVGLGYLTLDRTTRTLSGGETGRVHLTTCLGTRLVETLYVLDEPSVGLHPRDIDRLVRLIEHLRDIGNTVVVVEHESSVMQSADHIIDLGPGHGEQGGEVMFEGPPSSLHTAINRSLTADYLSGNRTFPKPPRRPVHFTKSGPGSTAALALSEVYRHNLKNLSVSIPLARLVCITGVSGSGKSTLIREVLVPILTAQLEQLRKERFANSTSKTLLARGKKPTDSGDPEPNDPDEDASVPDADSTTTVLPSARLTGFETLDEVLFVDQSPVGRTPRSTPAVYIGALDSIRDIFLDVCAHHGQRVTTGTFSFNSSGQCPTCRGAGFEKIEMQFLSDIFIRCGSCNGRRYRQETLNIRITPLPDKPEWSIADVLEATTDDAIRWLGDFKHSQHAIVARRSLQILSDVGLGYLRLGQPLNTLSGGESQRLKLAGHIARQTKAARNLERARTLFLFDEPTTGLHMEDIRILLNVFQRLVDEGHSVVIIEHHLDVVAASDWIVDLGPEAGEDGGRLVIAGTPEQVAACPTSHTGRFLKPVLAAPVDRPAPQRGSTIPAHGEAIGLR